MKKPNARAVPKSSTNRADVISVELDELIGVLQGKLTEIETTFSVGDVLRLMNGRKEADGAESDVVTVQWVTECKDSASEE